MMLSSPNPSIAKSYDPWLTRPKHSTAPPGLRNLPPVQKLAKPVEKPVLTPSQVKGPPQHWNQTRRQPCGTEAAAKRHVAKREPLCAECQAGRDARNSWKNGTGTRKPRKATAACGSHGGYSRHKREQTPVCDPCREARNATARKLAAKKRMEKAA